MLSMATDELTLPERAILTSDTAATYLDQFSSAERVLVHTLYQPAQAIRKRKYYSRGQSYLIKWQDFGQPLPLWFDPLIQGFVDVLTLPPGWDSYRADAIDPKIVHDAMNFINAILGPATPAPRVVPLSSGGLQLEWHRHGIDLEVVFDRDDDPFFYYRARQANEGAEYSLSENAGRLISILETLE